MSEHRFRQDPGQHRPRQSFHLIELGRAELNRSFLAMVAGDRAACRMVVAYAEPILHAQARHQLRTREDSLDLVQNVMLKIVARMHEFDPNRGDALAWMLAIARFEIKTHRKRRLRLRESSAGAFVDSLTAAERSPEAQAIANQMALAVHHLLSRMHAVDTNLLMHDVRDEANGPQLPGTRKKLQRARARFAQAWRETYGTEWPYDS